MLRAICLSVVCLSSYAQAEDVEKQPVEVRGTLRAEKDGHELHVADGRYFLKLNRERRDWCKDYVGQEVVVNGEYASGGHIQVTRIAAGWFDKRCEEMVDECNRYRLLHGLHVLEPLPALMLTAQRHTWNMRHRQGMSHGGTSGWSGENIAAGQPDPISVTRTWYNSSGHRANMLSSRFRYIGVGHDGRYWTQQFK